MKRDKSHFFWISYSDLMTSLFFIMLVLFVLAKVEWDKAKAEWEKSTEDIRRKNIELEEKEKERQALIDSLEKAKIVSEEQLRKIEEIQKSVSNLDTNYFRYDAINRRYTLKRQIEFYTAQDYLKNENDENYIVDVGQAIQNLTDRLKSDYRDKDVKYVVIIEGMSSHDSQSTEDFNYPLSYKRAWRIKRTWDKKGIRFNDIVDVQVAGSGTGGIGREQYEAANQRILIHIIPKIGNIK